MRIGAMVVVLLSACVAACSRSPASEPAVLVAEPARAPAEATPAAQPPDRAPEPGAIPSRDDRDRCIRLGDDSGWTCSPAARSPEELAGLLRVAIGRSLDPDASLPAVEPDVTRAPGSDSSSVALLRIDADESFGEVRALIAFVGPGGWGYAADAGTLSFGVNSGGSAELVAVRRDGPQGLLVVDTEWKADDSACTEPVSWTMHELRSTVCEPSRLLCRTIPTERTVVEERYDDEGERVTRRRTLERFRATLSLDSGGRVHLRGRSGRAPRKARPLARPTRLALVDPGIEPFAR